MKVYLDDEKTHVDPCPHNGHSVGWTVMTETIVIRVNMSYYIFTSSQKEMNLPVSPGAPTPSIGDSWPDRCIIASE